MNATDPLSAARRASQNQRQRPLPWRILVGLMSFLAAMWFLFDDSVGFVLRPAANWLKLQVHVDGLKRWVTAFGPYGSLALLILPMIVVEPAKLLAIYLFGAGFYITGALTLLLAYAAGIGIIERIFELNKSKLLSIGWFARIYAVWSRLHEELYANMRNSPAWIRARRWARDLRRRLHRR